MSQLYIVRRRLKAWILVQEMFRNLEGMQHDQTQSRRVAEVFGNRTEYTGFETSLAIEMGVRRLSKMARTGKIRRRRHPRREKEI